MKDKDYYADAITQMDFFENFASMIAIEVVINVANENKALIDNPTDVNTASLLELIDEKAESFINGFSNNECCDEFIDYTFEMFVAYSDAVFLKIRQFLFTKPKITLNDALFNKLKQAVYVILKAKEDISDYTGLIFTGFGDDEIYPQLIAVNISMVVNGRLRYYIDNARSASISNQNAGAVCPFAQTDVIDTILKGIDPTLDNTYLENFAALFKKYNENILNAIGDANPLLSAQITAIDIELISNEFSNMNSNIKREKHILPLLNAVNSLSKEDLAEMAESLIYLTYLKRRITFAEESVGGPVDVAVISKGDGLVWIKRKQYFDPELNKHFFDNYLKK